MQLYRYTGLGNSSSSKQTGLNILRNVGQSSTKLMKLHTLMTSLKSKTQHSVSNRRSTSTHQKWIYDNKKEHPALDSKGLGPKEKKPSIGSYNYL